MHTLTKRLFSLGVFLFLVASPVAPALAQTQTQNTQSGLLFGQRHTYSVVFRGNGEAVTYAKIVLTNPTEQPLTTFSFELPKVTPSEMTMYQMELPAPCLRYDTRLPERPCLEYREADYSQDYYYDNYYGGNKQAQYSPVQYTVSAHQYQLTLPKPVEANKTTALIIAYAAKGYVTNQFGLYRFNFETLKVPSRIQELRVSVDVDSDLLLKGKRSEVSYASGPTLGSGDLGVSAISNASLDRVVNDIGSYGPLVKEAKNLAPEETFIVKGSYAKTWFRLYLGSIALTVFIIAAILAGVYLLSRYLKKRHMAQMPAATARSRVSPTPTEPIHPLTFSITFTGFISAALVVGLTFLVTYLGENDLIYSFESSPLIGLVMLIALILLYVLLMVGPAILVAVKRGWKALLWVLLAEFIWFLVLLFVFITFFQSASIGGGYGGRMMY